jgi:hypothetical protein
VRQRHFLQRRITALKCKVRHVLCRYNADIPSLFTKEGRTYLHEQSLTPADRFVVEQLLAGLDGLTGQLLAMNDPPRRNPE